MRSERAGLMWLASATGATYTRAGTAVAFIISELREALPKPSLARRNTPFILLQIGVIT
jgi:hypothetical protein